MNNRELDLRVADEVFKIIHYRDNDHYEQDRTRALLRRGPNNSCYAMCTFERLPAPHLMKPLDCPECGRTSPPDWERGDGNRYFNGNLPHYSTDLNDAIKVIDHLRTIGWSAQITQQEDPSVEWSCSLWRDIKSVGAIGKTIPEAICLAALRIGAK